MKKVNIVLGISAAVMLISAAALITTEIRDRQKADYWEQIKRLKEENKDWSGQNILPAYRALYEKNDDIVGWIELEGQRIDFPVMQTKDNPEYYLRRNFDKQNEDTGVPFADYRCDVVPYQSFNTIIYGHYTSADSMFRRLMNYESPKWYAEHKEIRFNTLTAEGVYEVAAVFYADVTDVILMDEWDASKEDAYAFYNYIEIDSEEGFETYRQEIDRRKLYETQTEITPDAHVITLITCAPEEFSGYRENGRMVVIAVKKN